MSTPQILSAIKEIYRLGAKGTATYVPYERLNGHSGNLAKEASLDIVEEAIIGQDKMMRAHLNLVVLPSEIIQKRAKQQTGSKQSLYEKTNSQHLLNASIVPDGFRTIYAGRTV